jgi:hypothetical protein
MSQTLLNALASAVTDLCREAVASGVRLSRRTFKDHLDAIQKIVADEAEKAARDAPHPQTSQATELPRGFLSRSPEPEPDDANRGAPGLREAARSLDPRSGPRPPRR